MRLLASGLVLLALLSPAAAEDMKGDDIILELGGGGGFAPAYEGADEYTLDPTPIIKLHYLRIPGLGEFGKDSSQGFSIGPAFRYVAARESGDYDDLDGLDDVDAAIELGATVSYEHDWLRGFISLRRGLGGHQGFVGEAGADATIAVSEKTEFKVGPRVEFGDAEYMDTYFGVSPEEAVASGHDAFDPDGGIRSVGFEVAARHALTEVWAVRGTFGYAHLVGEAAKSPVVSSVDQFSASLGLSYKFGLDLFD